MDSFKCINNLDGLNDMEDTDEWSKPLTALCNAYNLNNDQFHQEHNRSIVHLDIDCFYAQVEMLFNPDLRNKPLGIQQKNIVITTNYLARELGVPKSTYVADAVKKWPQLVLVNGEDLTKYRQKSYEISEFLQKYSPKVERLGFDENFIDVSELVSWRLRDKKYKEEFIGYLHQSSISQAPCDCGCHLRLQIASQVAMDIREALEKELSITCSAGIAHNKLLAKLIGATHKPNQQTTILPPQAIELMSSFSLVRCIPGIGLSTGNTLQRIGISSVVELQKADRANLEKEFGTSTADFLINSSLGIDDSPVIKFEQPQSMSDEDSFQCCNIMEDAECRIKGLIQSLLKRVSEDGRIPQTVRLTVRRIFAGAQTWEKYRKRESRQCPVPRAVFTALQRSVDEACELLMPILINLFTKLVDATKPFHLTLINIGFTNLLKPAETKNKISSYFMTTLNEEIVDGKNNNAPSNQTSLSKVFKRRRILFNQDLIIHPLPQDLQNQTVLENNFSETVSNNKNNLSVSDLQDEISHTDVLDNDSIETSGLCTKDRAQQFKCSNKTDDSNSDRHDASVSQVSSLKRPAEAEIDQSEKCRKNSYSLKESCDTLLQMDCEQNSRIPEQYQKEEEALIQLAIEMSKQAHSTSIKDQVLHFDQGVEITRTSLSKQTPDKKLNNFCSQSNSKNIRKLPAGIDPSVFSELPKNIQSEILAHVAMASSPKPSLKKSVHIQNTKPSKHKEKEQSKEKSSILKYFSRNT